MNKIYSAVETVKGFKACVSVRTGKRAEKILYISPKSVGSYGEAMATAAAIGRKL